MNFIYLIILLALFVMLFIVICEMFSLGIGELEHRKNIKSDDVKIQYVGHEDEEGIYCFICGVSTNIYMVHSENKKAYVCEECLKDIDDSLSYGG